MKNIYINRRQFVIAPTPFYNKEKKWNSIKINKSFYLTHHIDLPVIRGLSKDGDIFFILGIAIQTNPKRKEPHVEAKDFINKIEEIYDSWAGRWIYLNEKELHTDFSGLLGCFYVRIKGLLWISSSVAILSDIIGSEKNFENNSLKDSGMNWYPPPRSRNPLINSLLPSQVLLLPEGNIRARNLFPTDKLTLSKSEALDLIQTSLITGMLNISKNKKVWIALTAGYDSRLLLAAAIKANISVKTYTMRKRNKLSFFNRRILTTSLVSYADMSLPPIISKKVNVEHRWINEKEFILDNFLKFNMHTYNQTIENDRIYFSKGQWDWAKENYVFLLGQVAEIGSCNYYKLLNKSGLKPSNEMIITKFRIKKNSLQEQGIEEYVKWVNNYLKIFPELIDWRDRFYLEQRLAGWGSSLQQGLDLVKGERIHLYNSQQILCALLSIPKEIRIQKLHIKELIQSMIPELNDIPYNSPDPFLYMLNKNIIKLIRNPLKENISIIYRKCKKIKL